MQDRSDTQNSPFKIDPIQGYIEASEAMREGTGERFLRGTLASALKAPTLVDETNNYLFQRPEDENASMRSVMETIKPASPTSFGEKTNDFISDFVGQSLSFLPLGMANIGAHAAEAMSPYVATAARALSPHLAHLAETAIPSLGIKGITETTVGEMGKAALSHAGSLAGFTAPEALEESYNYETNKFNLGKASIEIAANGAIGAFVPAGQFLLGIFGKRVGRLLESKVEAKIPETEEQKPVSAENPQNEPTKPTFQEQEIAHWADKAYQDGKLNKRQRDWVLKQEETPDSPAVQKEAAEILKQMGHKADVATGKVKIPLASESDVTNATNGAHDAIASDAADPHALSNFAYHNSLDRLRLDPEIADGIDGYTAYIDHHLSLESIKIPALEKEIFGEDRVSYSPEQMEMPVTHENIQGIVKNIYDNITDNGKAIKGFRNKSAYHDLEDLAYKWPQARKLLDRINLEDSHNAQRAYSEVLKNYSAMIKAPLGQVAKPETVSDYLKQKLEQQFKKPEKTEVIEPEFKPKMEQPKNESNEEANAKEGKSEENANGEESNQKVNEGKEKGDEDLKQDNEYMESVKGGETKKQYAAFKKQYSQWKGASKVLDNLISCVMGTTNGEI